MYKIIRTDSTNSDFIKLVTMLDAVLAELDGEEHAFYAQLNKVDALKNVVVAYDGEEAIGCGAMKEFDQDSMEIKRMYTLPAHRGKGVAANVLEELEKWANELAYRRCVLETGKRQPEAIALYHKKGYNKIPNYGKYEGIENSVCFQKILS